MNDVSVPSWRHFIIDFHMFVYYKTFAYKV